MWPTYSPLGSRNVVAEDGRHGIEPRPSTELGMLKCCRFWLTSRQHPRVGRATRSTQAARPARKGTRCPDGAETRISSTVALRAQSPAPFDREQNGHTVDAEFTDRWRNRREPFNGITLEMPWPGKLLGDLRSALRQVVDVLQKRDGGHLLYTLEDWHQHDGYVMSAALSNWVDVLDSLSSDEAILRKWPGDTYVRRGYFPDHRGWYLRIWFDDDEELDELDRPTRGTFDLTGPEDLTSLLYAKIPGLETHPAAAFFDEKYAGDK